MNKEMEELGKILTMLEEAGFTVTYLSAHYFAHSFTIVIKSETILESNYGAEQFKHEPAAMSDIADIFKNIGYEIIKYVKKWEVATEYSGTIYLEIAPFEKETSQESTLGH